MSTYIDELRKVLITFDEGRIKNFLRENGRNIPEKGEVFWVAVHKAICNLPNATKEEKQNSELWLRSRGFKPGIGG